VSAYRTPEPVAEDDLTTLLAEARIVARQRRLEERLRVLARLMANEDEKVGPARVTSDVFDVFGILFLPVLAVAIVLQCLALSLVSVLRGWTEWRRYGHLLHSFPWASALALAILPVASLVAVVVTSTDGAPVGLIAAGVGVIAIAANLTAACRGEWSTRYQPWLSETS